MVQNKGASQKTLDQLSVALDSGTFVDVRRMLNGLSPPDVAHLLESSPPKFRHILWQMVEIDREGEVLGELKAASARESPLAGFDELFGWGPPVPPPRLGCLLKTVLQCLIAHSSIPSSAKRRRSSARPR